MTLKESEIFDLVEDSRYIFIRWELACEDTVYYFECNNYWNIWRLNIHKQNKKANGEIEAKQINGQFVFCAELRTDQLIKIKKYLKSQVDNLNDLDVGQEINKIL